MALHWSHLNYTGFKATPLKGLFRWEVGCLPADKSVLALVYMKSHMSLSFLVSHTSGSASKIIGLVEHSFEAFVLLRRNSTPMHIRLNGAICLECYCFSWISLIQDGEGNSCWCYVLCVEPEFTLRTSCLYFIAWSSHMYYTVIFWLVIVWGKVALNKCTHVVHKSNAPSKVWHINYNSLSWCLILSADTEVNRF